MLLQPFLYLPLKPSVTPLFTRASLSSIGLFQVTQTASEEDDDHDDGVVVTVVVVVVVTGGGGGDLSLSPHLWQVAVHV